MSGRYSSLLTPYTKVGVTSSLAGAVSSTFLGAALEVAGGFSVVLLAPVDIPMMYPRRTDPGDHGRVGLAEHPDLVAVDHQVAALMLHGAVEPAEHGVVLQQIDHIIHVCLPQVDAADLKLIGLLRQNAQGPRGPMRPKPLIPILIAIICSFLYPPPGAVFCSVYIIPNGSGPCLPFLCKMVHKIPGELFVTFEHPEQKIKNIRQIFHTFETFLTSFSKKLGRSAPTENRRKGSSCHGCRAAFWITDTRFSMATLTKSLTAAHGQDGFLHQFLQGPAQAVGPCWITSWSTRRRTLSLYFFRLLTSMSWQLLLDASEPWPR